MVAAACHIHSDWSYDGKWPLADLAKMFSRMGYRALMVTDHDRGFTESKRLEHREACARASSEAIFVMPGIEYSDASNTVHVLVWGSVPFLGEGLATSDLLRKVREANGVAVLAHPTRRQAWKVFDPGWTEYLLGMEVWNRKTDGWAPSLTAEPLMAGTSLLPFVGMDFHDRNQIFPLAMQLDLDSVVNEETIVSCLRARRCQALAFSRPVREVSHGWLRFALHPAERMRRSAAPIYRWAKGKRG